jgi:hypothetical protein
MILPKEAAMTVRLAGAMCLLALVLLLATPAGAAWIVTEIPTPPEWVGHTEPLGVNNDGVVCGVGNYVSGSSAVGFRYDGTTLSELPYLAPSVPYPLAYPKAINNGGVIAGWSHNDGEVDRAVVWIGDTVTQIPVPPDAKPTGDMRAYGINDADVVVGYYVGTDGYANAYYYDGTTHSLEPALHAAGLTGERSYAEDVNNNGLICGHAEDAGSDYVFFTYDIPTGTVNVLGKIWAAGQSYFTTAINDAGHVVGRGRTVPWSPIHALLHDGAFNVIDETVSVPQWATDIAEGGRVVGNADTSDSRWGWYSDGPGPGSMRLLELPGWTRISVSSVNDQHTMVGYGRTTASPDQNRGYLVAPPPGDADHDGDVDLADMAEFAECLSGPAGSAGFVSPSESCVQAFDFVPTDGDIDLLDFAGFQECFEGN